MAGASGNSLKILWIIIILLLFFLGYAYRSNLSDLAASFFKPRAAAPSQNKNESQTKAETPVYPDGFPATNVKEKTLDLNHNGKPETLLTSWSASSGARLALIDAEDRKKLLSNIFDFSTAGYPEAEFKSDEAPEAFQILDLDGDGRDDLVLDLKSYGAYTNLFGALTFKASKLAWAILKDETGQKHLAIFEDGASVRNANIFKILSDQKPPALVQIYGGSEDGTNWTWNADAYSWNGSLFARVSELSGKIVSEQPKKIVNGQPVF